MRRSRSSISFRFFTFLLAAIFVRRSLANGTKRRSPEERTRDIATKDKPAERSDWPMLTTALSKVRPCDLWMVTAQASVSGKLVRACVLFSCSLVLCTGVIGTVLASAPYAAPRYSGKWHTTNSGRAGGRLSAEYTMSRTVPTQPLTRPAAT